MTAARVPLGLLLVTLVGANLALVLRFSSDLLSNDAAQYVSEARSILAGRGLATDIAYYDEHHRLGRFPVPQTVFPPGYPLAIAAVAKAGLREPLAAFALCLLAFNLSVALTYASVRHASASPQLSALSGIAVAGSVAACVGAIVANSEMLFLASTLAALVCLQQLPRGGPWPSLLAGLSAAAAVSVRYAGVFLLAGLGVVMLARVMRLRSRRAMLELVLTLAPGALTTGLLLARNYLLVGDAMGGNAYELSRAAVEVLATFARGVQGLLGYSRAGLEAGRPQELFLIAACVGLAGLAIGARPEWRGGFARRLAQDEGAGLALAYIGVSLGALWHLERTRHLGVSSRMLLPLVPFGLVLVAAAASSLRFRNAKLGASGLATLLGAVYLVGQTGLLPPQELARREAKLRGLRLALQRSDPAERLLSQDARARRPFLANEPQAVASFRAQPIVGLTSAHYSGTRWTSEATERLARGYGVRHVVFFRQAFLEAEADASSGTANQDFFRSLARGDVPAWLRAVDTDAEAQLFEVRE